jgi:hypothetical protein
VASALVVDWRRWAGQVVDLVHLEQDGVDDIMPYQLKVGLVEEVRDVVLRSSEEIIHADDLDAANSLRCAQAAITQYGGAQTQGV